MKAKLKNIINKKCKGISELISSIIVIVTLIIMLFLSLGFIQDVQTITAIDQITRQGIVKVETYGYLDDTTLTSIKTSLLDNCKVSFNGSKLINGTTVPDGVYMAYENGGSWTVVTSSIDSLSSEVKKEYFGYGKTVGLYIQCEMYGTGIDTNGNIGKNSKTQVCRLKSSVSKTL